jgi:hypothetical protein
MRYRHWHLQTQTVTSGTQTRGSRLGSLYYSITNLTRDLPADLACDVDVVEGAPVTVVGARRDGVAVRQTVLGFILVMTQRSPKVPPGVPAAGVEGDLHVRPRDGACSSILPQYLTEQNWPGD